MKLATSVALAVLALAALPAVKTAAADPTIVKLATLVPEGSVWDKILRDMGGQWSAETQGRVSLRVYPGGVAGDEPDIVRKMRIGQIQAAALTSKGLAEIDPAFQVFGIPTFFVSYPELFAVLEKLEPLLKQRLEARGFVLLNWGHGGWVYFFTKQPVQSVDDMRKTKMFVWAGDDRMVQLWKDNGFRPVALAATDILTGLQTGMIETYETTPLAALSLQWFRTTPYMVDQGLGPLVGALVISKSAWSKISEADRARLRAACGRAEVRLEAEVPKQDSTSVEEMQKRGLKVMHVSPANMADWRKTAQEFAAGMRGAIVPPDILDLAERERNAWRETHTGRGSH